MKVIQEKLPASQICLEIEIDGSSSQKTYDKVVRELARSTNIPGFRKGKVPRHILLQRIGLGRIKAAALEEIVQKSLEDVIKSESIDSIGNLKLLSNFSELIGQYKPGEPLTFSASVDVAPDVELGDYHSMKVKAEEIVADPSQVDDFLAERQQEQATLVPVEDRPALMGDVATIDFKGRFAAAEGEEGELIPRAEAQDFEVEVAKGKLIEGLIEGIVGMRIEETKEVAVTFPEDYAQEDLAGKAAVFTIVLKELKEKELPELDDDLAEEISEFETMAELRQSLTEQFSQKAADDTKNNIHKAIIAQLSECCSVQLPETMIENEVENILTRSAIMMQNYGLDIQKMFNADKIPVMRERSRQEAIENLQKSLFLKKIAQLESITVDIEKVEARIKEVTQQLSESKQEYESERLQKMVEEELLEESTLDWLQEKTKVELVPVGSLSSSETEEKPPETDAVDASALIEG